MSRVWQTPRLIASAQAAPPLACRAGLSDNRRDARNEHQTDNRSRDLSDRAAPRASLGRSDRGTVELSGAGGNIWPASCPTGPPWPNPKMWRGCWPRMPAMPWLALRQPAATPRVDRAAFFTRFSEGEAVPYFYEPFKVCAGSRASYIQGYLSATITQDRPSPRLAILPLPFALLLLPVRTILFQD